VVEKLWQLFLTIQLTIAEIFDIDYTQLMRTIFQLPEVRKTITSIFAVRTTAGQEKNVADMIALKLKTQNSQLRLFSCLK
jgi:hypothetical protein